MGSREFEAWKAYYGRGVQATSEERPAMVDALALLDAQGTR